MHQNLIFSTALMYRNRPGGTAYDELRRVFDFIHEGSGDARRRAPVSYTHLLEHLKGKTPTYYDANILVPNGKTLADFIAV